MKYGYDELTQAVRLNDVSIDGLRQSMPEIAESFGVDIAALEHVATQRAAMSIEILRREGMMGDSPKRKTITQATIAASWFDGFFAALNMLQQEQGKYGLGHPDKTG